MTLFKTMTVLAIAFASQSVFAQNVRPCTNEVLNCKLENTADFYNITTIGTSTDKFSGVNDDEPSIQPDECKIITGIDDKNGILYTVNLGDSDYMVDIFARSMSNLGSVLPGEVAFKVTPGMPFYFRYGTETLTCTLK